MGNKETCQMRSNQPNPGCGCGTWQWPAFSSKPRSWENWEWGGGRRVQSYRIQRPIEQESKQQESQSDRVTLFLKTPGDPPLLWLFSSCPFCALATVTCIQFLDHSFIPHVLTLLGGGGTTQPLPQCKIRSFPLVIHPHSTLYFSGKHVYLFHICPLPKD